MDDFRFYLPIEKSAFPSGSHEKIVETINGETRTRYKIKGIASTTTLDRDNEIVSKLCLKKMETQINNQKLPIFSNHNHDWEDMLGYTNVALATDKHLEIDILTDYVETNPKVMQLIGKVEGEMPIALSIGGKVLDSRPRKNKDGEESKILDDVDLYETSVVGIGACPDAFLSLPEQIKKSMTKNIEMKNEIRYILSKGEIDKGESSLSDKTIKEIINVVEKNSGQLGMANYGKLGETTPESHCPKCKTPAALRMVENGNSHYQCSKCDLPFSVKAPVKLMTTDPKNNPLNPSAQTIDNQGQSVLGRKSANQEKKGDLMEKEEKSESAPEETPVEKPEEVTEKEAGCNAEEDEKEYQNKFLKFLKRAISEGVFKAEGVSTTPGGENANPKNTLGGGGGAATPVHQKTAFESAKKAFQEEAGAESFSTAKVEKKEDYSFVGMRKKMLTRK